MYTRTGVRITVLTAMLAAGGAALSAAPALAQSTDPCLALPTDAERLACMRDARAAAQAAAESAAEAARAAQAAAEAAARAAQAAEARMASPAPAAAQTAGQAAPGQSAADRCLALPSDAERLSCMRDALAMAEAALAAQGGEEQDDGGFLGLGIFGGGSGARPNALVASESAFAAGLGAEQVTGRSDSRETDEDVRVQASIVNITEWVPGVNQFELDNGQVWRQLGGDTQQVRLGRSDSHAVELFGSWAGGYRMRIPSQRQTVMVERIR